MIIRKAKLSDVKAIISLWKSFMKEHDEIVLKKSPEKKKQRKRIPGAHKSFEKHLKKNIRSRNGFVLVAQLDTKIIGYSLSYIQKSHPLLKITHVGYISDLYVKKEYRGTGVSTRFKDETITWFKSKNITFVTIAYNVENTLVESIYEKWGFVKDHIEMWKQL